MRKINLSMILSLCCIYLLSQANEYQYKKDHHQKEIIGYFTNWDAWKAENHGVTKGFYNQLNIDYSQYTILNWSFLGVAKDGSLHSGDLRNKNIYQDGTVQEPGPMFYDDVYSSFDYWLLYGELETIQYLPTDLDQKPDDPLYWAYEKYGYTGTSTGWLKPSTGETGTYPLPLPKPNGAKGLLELAHDNGVKVMASIGGWSMSKHFQEMAADPVKRAKFLEDCAKLIDMGFDGIDLDWEYPGPFSGMNFTGTQADYDNFENLVIEIRNTIGPDKLITAAFSATPQKLNGFDWSILNQYMDFYNMMTYDFHGGWSNIAGHNSPLYPYDGEEYGAASLDTTFQFLVQQGVPPSKINLGVAFYGRGVITSGQADLNTPTVKVSKTIQPDGPISTAGDYTNWGNFDATPTHYYIESNKAGWTYHWDDQAKVPYLTKDNYFLSFDDARSIEEKAKYVNSKNAAGVIIWQAFADLQPGTIVETYAQKLPYAPTTEAPLVNTLNRVFAQNGTPDNQLPSIQFQSPQNNQVFIQNTTDTVIIKATISDSDGTIAAVNFTVNGESVSYAVSNQEYTVNFIPSVLGSYEVAVSATDNDGDTATSTLTFSVEEEQQVIPTIAFVNPTNGQTITLSSVESININLQVTDAENELSNLQISVDGQTFNGSSATWTPSAFGNFTVTASADYGSTVIEESITITVTETTSIGEGCNGIEAWSSQIYSTSGTQVVFDGKVYQNKWYAGAADAPGSSDVWEFVTYCEGNEPDLSQTCGYEAWNPSAPYTSGGQKVYYNGKIYQNKWWTNGIAPDASADWEYVSDCNQTSAENVTPATVITEVVENNPSFSASAANALVSDLITPSLWNELFPNRYGQSVHITQPDTTDFYSYDNFVEAVQRMQNIEVTFERRCASNAYKITRKDKTTGATVVIREDDAFTTSQATIITHVVDYGSFLSEGNIETQKRELMAFLANIAQETTGGWATAPGGKYAWGLYFREEVSYAGSSSIGYVDTSNALYPPTAGKSYHGRGPIQLSWNYNYGQVSQFLYGDKQVLLDQPEKVIEDGALAFQTAIWFWMTPQYPKPSAHDSMVGNWQPTQDQQNAGLIPGFGSTVNIINGGIECNGGTENTKVLGRIGHYERFTDLAGIGMALDGSDNVMELGCANMPPFQIDYQECTSLPESASLAFANITNGAYLIIQQGESIIIDVTVNDPEQTVSNIQISVDGQTFNGSSVTWIPSAFGSFTITASADDQGSLIEQSITVTIINEEESTGCEGIAAWESNIIYSTTGTQVVFEGSIYQNKWYANTNEQPGTADVWEFVKYCKGSEPDLSSTCGYEEWKAQKAYAGGLSVYYNHAIYQSNWWTQGSTPSSSSEWSFVSSCTSTTALRPYTATSENIAFKVYPNPTANILHIQSDKSIATGIIYSLTGQAVQSFQSSKINVNRLQSGAYILKVIFSDGSSSSTKFSKK